MSNKNKLAIYLIKNEFTEFKEIINEQQFTVHKISDEAIIYSGTSKIKTPSWVDNFLPDDMDTSELYNANSKAIMLQKVFDKNNNTIRIFAIPFGYGKFMLDDDVIETNFGLKVVLNSISEDSIRQITRVNVGGNQKISKEQLPSKSNISSFDFNEQIDLIKNITVSIEDDELLDTGNISGHDALYITKEISYKNIKEFLSNILIRYSDTVYLEKFGWIDNIKLVREKSLINKLDNELINHIADEISTIIAAVPDVIDWTDLSGFQTSKDIFDDLEIECIIDSYSKPLTNVEQLKSKYIYAISSKDGSKNNKWSFYKCLIAEIQFENKDYCLNNGKWYCMDKNYVEKINKEFSKIKSAPLKFPVFDKKLHESEGLYSKYFVTQDKQNRLLLDKELISYGGGHSKFEFCDVLVEDNTAIHLKQSYGSSSLSHLFNQGLVAAKLYVSDEKFKEKVNEKIDKIDNTGKFKIINPKDMKIVFGIIKSSKNDEVNHPPKLPLFSKITFLHVIKELELIGIDAYIVHIPKI